MKKIVAVLLSFSAFNAHSITNIENQRLKPLQEGLSGHVELTLDGKSGNSEEEDFGFAGRVNHKKGDDLFFVIASKEYGTSNDEKDTDKNFLHGRWVHKLDAKLSSEAFAQYQDNEFTRLLSRYLVGGGVRYKLAEDDSMQLAVGGGAFYVKEKEDLATYDDTNDYFRFNSYVSYKHQLNGNVSLLATAYYQPRISDFSDYHVLLNTALLAKLSEQLKLKVALQVGHDSEPAQNLEADPVIDVESTDTEYSVSLVYDF